MEDCVKMINKRGAMELSINTIIIIVIGVALLSFGLLFLGDIKDKVFSLGEKAFGEADTALTDLNQADAKLTVASSVSVKKGDSTNFQITVGNEKQTKSSFTIEVKPAADNLAGEKLKISIPRSQFEIESGAGKRLTAGVTAAENIVQGSYAYLIEVKADGQAYESGEFFVNVK